jgi:uncharacterized protein (TIGR00369 family)
MRTPAEINEERRGTLPDLIGVEVTEAAPGRIRGRLEIRANLLGPSGNLHAGTVVALADSLCGAGAIENRPPDARGHSTIDLTANLIGTAREGEIECEAVMVHGGRTSQVSDARVTANGKLIAIFRCTQMILYARGDETPSA